MSPRTKDYLITLALGAVALALIAFIKFIIENL